MIVLVAELADLKTDLSVPASGIVIESTLDNRKGISATLLIKNGVMETGAYAVANNALTPIRFIENFKGEKIEKAQASMPVRILGWNIIPTCGAKFIIIKNKKEAEQNAEENDTKIKADSLELAKNQAFELRKQAAIPKTESQDDKTSHQEPTIVTLPIIIKADVVGSLEGVKHELAKIGHDKVKLKIVAEGIGNINENDVKIAQGDPKIMIIGFNAEPDNKARAIIERSAIPLSVQSFTIIYELSKFVNDSLIAKIPKEYIEEMTGRAKILAVFSKEKDRQVIGGKCETGEIGSGNDVRIMRRETEVGRGKIRELQSKKIRVQSVAEGFEFGMLVEAKVEIAVGDRIEAVRIVEKV